MSGVEGGVRAPAVAGSFYPAVAETLRAAVTGYLSDARAEISVGPRPKALIAPHAGYVYSGAVAASAYAQLAPVADEITRVVLVGPAHYVPVRGIAVSRADAFRTPLGDVAIDGEAVERIVDLPGVVIDERPHGPEHALEVHLPFLQSVLGEFSLVPLAVGHASPEDVARVLDRLWGGTETLIVISSDLSHFHEYRAAQALDRATAQAIETGDIAALGPEQACGCIGIGGMLLAARRHGLTIERLDLRNSGDTAGSRDSVVGYGAWALVHPVDQPHQKSQRPA
ncbi:MAG: AmmeMemoRadiSam system protein B [Alphaproteobacteria bacterium]|nr:AmmeMemoRadiSam system protein B [Alphaproteobacteria bacterium]